MSRRPTQFGFVGQANGARRSGCVREWAKVLTVDIRPPMIQNMATALSHNPDLTPHQRTVLSYIDEFQRKRGYSPSLADLAIAFGVRSKNAVATVINALTREGHIEKDPKGRIKILDYKEREECVPLALPLFGPVPAGRAAAAEDHVQDELAIQSYLVRKPSKSFLLRVKGDSMINAGIFEGDIVVAEKGQEPQVGDIVIGMLDGEFTLKRLRKNKGKYYLQAENPDYPDLHAREDLQIAGVVRGVVRRY